MFCQGGAGRAYAELYIKKEVIMSYCVNCGVELDGALEECPLCNTPVINPRELVRQKSRSPFPAEKGTVETIRRKDLGILTSSILGATAVACGVLNLLVFTGVAWSLAVIGACLLLWVMMIPLVIDSRQPIYLSLLFDGVAAGLYLFMLSFLTDGQEWMWGLGIPIAILVTVIAELLTICIKNLPSSFLTNALYVVNAVGLLCLGLEILIDLYVSKHIALSWSAVVLTVTVCVDAMLITVLSRRRLRNEVRRRLHF